MWRKLLKKGVLATASCGLISIAQAQSPQFVPNAAPDAAPMSPAYVLPQAPQPAPATAQSLPAAAPAAPVTALPSCIGVGTAPAGDACATCDDPKKPLQFTIGGQYRMLPNFSNFSFQPLTIGPDSSQQTQSFVNERLRLWLTVNPNEHVEGYIQVQIGNILWGDDYEFSKIFDGPGGADKVGIMLRRGWVSYQDDCMGKWRAGIVDWHDSFGDTLASSDYDFQVGGVDWTKTYAEWNKLKLTAGAFILTDQALVQSDEPPGHHDAFLFTFDADQPLAEKTSVGFSTYYIADQGGYSYPTIPAYKSSWDLWVGLRAKTFIDPVPINGFVIMNVGQREDLDSTTFEHLGYAAKLEAGPIPLGPGNLSVQTLYASGSSHPETGDYSTEFRTVAQTYRDNFGSQGYWSYMYLTSPNGPADVNDLGVGLQDRSSGLLTFQGKYEYPLMPRLNGISSVGWLRSASANPFSTSSNIGTELAQQFTYNFGGGLKLDMGAAYLLTGDYYKPTPDSPQPANLWEIFTRLQLEF